MPVYAYACTACGHAFDARQSFDEKRPSSDSAPSAPYFARKFSTRISSPKTSVAGEVREIGAPERNAVN